MRLHQIRTQISLAKLKKKNNNTRSIFMTIVCNQQRQIYSNNHQSVWSICVCDGLFCVAYKDSTCTHACMRYCVTHYCVDLFQVLQLPPVGPNTVSWMCEGFSMYVIGRVSDLETQWDHYPLFLYNFMTEKKKSVEINNWKQWIIMKVAD